MGLSVWFQEDVTRMLRAAYVAGRQAQRCLTVASRQSEWRNGFSESPDVGSLPIYAGGFSAEGEQATPGRDMVAFWHGYEAALVTISTAFGLALFEDSLGEEGFPFQLKRMTLQSRENGPGRRWHLDVRGEQT